MRYRPERSAAVEAPFGFRFGCGPIALGLGKIQSRLAKTRFDNFE